jgi:hypothetical protein
MIFSNRHWHLPPSLSASGGTGKDRRERRESRGTAIQEQGEIDRGLRAGETAERARLPSEKRPDAFMARW